MFKVPEKVSAQRLAGGEDFWRKIAHEYAVNQDIVITLRRPKEGATASGGRSCCLRSCFLPDDVSRVVPRGRS